MLCGGSFELTQAHSCITERCLQLWIERYNSGGIEAITYRPRSGRPRVISPDSVREEILPVLDDPSLAGQRHWTAVKLCGWLRESRDLDISYSTLVRYLHEQDYARRIPRPVPEPPNKDLWIDEREAFAYELIDLLEDPSGV